VGVCGAGCHWAAAASGGPRTPNQNPNQDRCGVPPSELASLVVTIEFLIEARRSLAPTGREEPHARAAWRALVGQIARGGVVKLVTNRAGRLGALWKAAASRRQCPCLQDRTGAGKWPRGRRRASSQARGRSPTGASRRRAAGGSSPSPPSPSEASDSTWALAAQCALRARTPPPRAAGRVRPMAQRQPAEESAQPQTRYICDSCSRLHDEFGRTVRGGAARRPRRNSAYQRLRCGMRCCRSRASGRTGREKRRAGRPRSRERGRGAFGGIDSNRAGSDW